MLSRADDLRETAFHAGTPQNTDIPLLDSHILRRGFPHTARAAWGEIRMLQEVNIDHRHGDDDIKRRRRVHRRGMACCLLLGRMERYEAQRSCSVCSAMASASVATREQHVVQKVVIRDASRQDRPMTAGKRMGCSAAWPLTPTCHENKKLLLGKSAARYGSGMSEKIIRRGGAHRRWRCHNGITVRYALYFPRYEPPRASPSQLPSTSRSYFHALVRATAMLKSKALHGHARVLPRVMLRP